ncbi:phosphate uptake regulator [Paraburkholderia sp. WSM4177]|nr:phosphate uptake regulator [Paraburkholderia sp. WSM4177]MBB5488495.1 phosphate uptake regulator [Paraburkholderia sp. WSM4180]
MQASEIQKRFTHLQQSIEQASQTCRTDATLPKDLVECVDELDQQSASAKKVTTSNDQDRTRHWVDDLERIGDSAEKACERAANVNAGTKKAVSSVHAELSDLKKQLH